MQFQLNQAYGESSIVSDTYFIYSNECPFPLHNNSKMGPPDINWPPCHSLTESALRIEYVVYQILKVDAKQTFFRGILTHKGEEWNAK